MKEKFTLGPWKVSTYASTYIHNDNGRGICSTGSYSDGTGICLEENQANALLISKCPDMYGLLKNLIELPASDMDALRPDIQSLLNSVYNG